MRILLVTSAMPWPTHGGGNQRSNLLYRALQHRGEVDTVMISRYGKISSDKWQGVMENYGGQYLYEERLTEHQRPWRWAAKLHRSLPHRLTHAIWGWGVDFVPDKEVAATLRALVERENYDLIVGRYMWALARSGVMGMRPTLLDVDDFETDVIEADKEVKQPTGLQLKWIDRRFKQVSRIEQKFLDQCDHVWVAKARDTKRVGHDRCSILPNIPFVKDGQASVEPCPPNNTSKNVLMVGLLEHTVNLNAIEVFLSGTWQKIHQRVPEARFQIVGNGMTDAMRRAWGAVPGVEPIGFAEDLRQAYSDAALTVVPIREGGGTKIKVLESMMYGRACVCASHSLRGYEHVLKHDEHIYVAPTDEDLIEGCVRLLNDPAKRAELAGAGGRQVRENFSLQRFTNIVLESVDKVCGVASTNGGAPKNQAFLAAS